MKNAAMEAALLILSRFELLTFRLGGGRSIQLSYRIIRQLNAANDNLPYFIILGNMLWSNVQELKAWI